MRYSDITADTIDNVVKNIQRYIDFTFELNNDFSFFDNFDIDRNLLDKIKNLCNKDIRTYLSSGLNNKIDVVKQEGADDYIEETLFFYPLVGILNAISREVYNL